MSTQEHDTFDDWLEEFEEELGKHNGNGRTLFKGKVTFQGQ
jgi:hypothetical protein